MAKKSLLAYDYPHHPQAYHSQDDPEKHASSSHSGFSPPASVTSSRRSSYAAVDYAYGPGSSLGFSSLASEPGGLMGHGGAMSSGHNGGSGSATGGMRKRSGWKTKVMVLLGMRFGWIVFVIWYEVGEVSFKPFTEYNPSRPSHLPHSISAVLPLGIQLPIPRLGPPHPNLDIIDLRLLPILFLLESNQPRSYPRPHPR